MGQLARLFYQWCESFFKFFKFYLWNFDLALGLESNVVLFLVAIMAETWIRVVANLVLLYLL